MAATININVAFTMRSGTTFFLSEKQVTALNINDVNSFFVRFLFLMFASIAALIKTYAGGGGDPALLDLLARQHAETIKTLQAINETQTAIIANILQSITGHDEDKGLAKEETLNKILEAIGGGEEGGGLAKEETLKELLEKSTETTEAIETLSTELVEAVTGLGADIDGFIGGQTADLDGFISGASGAVVAGIVAQTAALMINDPIPESASLYDIWYRIDNVDGNTDKLESISTDILDATNSVSDQTSEVSDKLTTVATNTDSLSTKTDTVISKLNDLASRLNDILGQSTTTNTKLSDIYASSEKQVASLTSIDSLEKQILPSIRNIDGNTTSQTETLAETYDVLNEQISECLYRSVCPNKYLK